MSKKQINVVFLFDFGIRAFFGLGIHQKLLLTSLNVSLGVFCSILRSIFTPGQS
jgi:hypothetical protein